MFLIGASVRLALTVEIAALFPLQRFLPLVVVLLCAFSPGLALQGAPGAGAAANVLAEDAVGSLPPGQLRRAAALGRHLRTRRVKPSPTWVRTIPFPSPTPTRDRVRELCTHRRGPPPLS